jgi:hypothetical protein
VANAGNGTVRLFRGEDFAPAGNVDLGNDADAISLKTHAGRFLVGYGSGEIAALDPASGTVSVKVALPAHPEGFQVDAEGRRAG